VFARTFWESQCNQEQEQVGEDFKWEPAGSTGFIGLEPAQPDSEGGVMWEPWMGSSHSYQIHGNQQSQLLVGG
jgi:hypothetical protein